MKEPSGHREEILPNALNMEHGLIATSNGCAMPVATGIAGTEVHGTSQPALTPSTRTTPASMSAPISRSVRPMSLRIS